jgi:hypothetical protein
MPSSAMHVRVCPCRRGGTFLQRVNAQLHASTQINELPHATPALGYERGCSCNCCIHAFTARAALLHHRASTTQSSTTPTPAGRRQACVGVRICLCHPSSSSSSRVLLHLQVLPWPRPPPLPRTTGKVSARHWVPSQQPQGEEALTQQHQSQLRRRPIALLMRRPSRMPCSSSSTRCHNPRRRRKTGSSHRSRHRRLYRHSPRALLLRSRQACR